MQGLGIAAQSSAAEQIVVRRNNQFRFLNCARTAICERRMLIIASQQVDTRKLIAGRYPLDRGENRSRLEWTDAGLWPQRLRPRRVPLRFARARAARLSD